MTSIVWRTSTPPHGPQQECTVDLLYLPVSSVGWEFPKNIRRFGCKKKNHLIITCGFAIAMFDCRKARKTIQKTSLHRQKNHACLAKTLSKSATCGFCLGLRVPTQDANNIFSTIKPTLSSSSIVTCETDSACCPMWLLWPFSSVANPRWITPSLPALQLN